MKRTTIHPSTRTHRVAGAACAGLCAACAFANEIRIETTTTSTFTVRTETTICHDAASAAIPGMAPMAVMDGHPSIAERTAPINPATGTPWSKAKGYANCPSEHWTACIALAGMPNPFSPPTASARTWNEVIVTSVTGTVTTATVHVIIIPERPMMLYDLGVFGDTYLNYSLWDSRVGAPIWQKNIHFTGAEAGPQLVDGTHWAPLPGPISLVDLGSFDRGWALQESFFDIFVEVQLQPLETVRFQLSLSGDSRLGQQSVGPQGAQYAVVTNSLGSPCYANCDGSSNPPVLNVADFSCFLNRFAAGDSYANCDRSTNPPVLNVADFSCFLNAFAAGCTA